MNIWVTITLIAAAIVFAIDYLLRRKKWEDNSKEEKISLAVNMFSVGPYLFFISNRYALGHCVRWSRNRFGRNTI